MAPVHCWLDQKDTPKASSKTESLYWPSTAFDQAPNMASAPYLKVLHPTDCKCCNLSK